MIGLSTSIPRWFLFHSTVSPHLCSQRCLANNEVKGQPLARVQVWRNKSIFSSADHESALYSAKRPSLWVWERERDINLSLYIQKALPSNYPPLQTLSLSGSLYWRSNYVGIYNPSSPKKKKKKSSLQKKKKKKKTLLFSMMCAHTCPLFLQGKRREGEKGWGKKSTSPSLSGGRDRVVLLRPPSHCARTHTHTPPLWITWKQMRLLRGALTSLIRASDSAETEWESEREMEWVGMEGGGKKEDFHGVLKGKRARGLTSWSGISEDRVWSRTVPVR